MVERAERIKSYTEMILELTKNLVLAAETISRKICDGTANPEEIAALPDLVKSINTIGTTIRF